MATPMGSGRASAKSVPRSIVASRHPITSAAAGNSGRMYEGSFELDALKKRKTNATQTRQNRAQPKRVSGSAGMRHAPRNPDRKMPIHGIRPTRNSGTKYHH